jgi:F-type H+-transporting ATPase subunit epsilon
MKVGVYSMQKVLFQGDAKSLNCNTVSGEITILDHHEPLISVLQKGTITILDHHQKEIFIPVDSGFLEIDSESQVKLLVEESK